jgi:saccharopine dehydrogenase-like NADP-dependent oxidoreductase
MSIGAQMLGRGLVEKTGVITPEEAFEPEAVFAELRSRQILIHVRIEKL